MIIIINNYVVRTLLRVRALAVVVVFCREIVLWCLLRYNYTVQQLLFIPTRNSLMYTLPQYIRRYQTRDFGQSDTETWFELIYHGNNI